MDLNKMGSDKLSHCFEIASKSWDVKNFPGGGSKGGSQGKTSDVSEDSRVVGC